MRGASSVGEGGEGRRGESCCVTTWSVGSKAGIIAMRNSLIAL